MRARIPGMRMTKTNKFQVLLYDMCAQRRLRSAWTYAQTDQRHRCQHEQSLFIGFGVQADLSLRWTHV